MRPLGTSSPVQISTGDSDAVAVPNAADVKKSSREVVGQRRIERAKKSNTTSVSFYLSSASSSNK
jgi:hypothetical protein